MGTIRFNLLRFFDPKSKLSINHYFREKRFLFFKRLLSEAGLLSDKSIRILDIGGTADYWERMKFSPQEKIHITLLNLEIYPVSNEHFTSIQGDARDLSQFKNNEFDLVFSNSVIEHLFTWESQMKMASEARRVGKSYYIQTPNYYFPIEPHWVFPFFHFLPFPLRVFLTMNFSLGHIERATSREEAFKIVSEVKLLTVNKMKELFPDGKVYNEKVLGLTKSITMYRT